MNFVAGFLLLFLEEEDAFWTLETIVNDILPNYYDHYLGGLQVFGRKRKGKVKNRGEEERRGERREEERREEERRGREEGKREGGRRKEEERREKRK
jgi:Rab-GTPase-TBC domain